MTSLADSAASAADCYSSAEALAMTVASALATYAVFFLLACLIAEPDPPPAPNGQAPNDRPPVRRAILRPPRNRSRGRSG